MTDEERIVTRLGEILTDVDLETTTERKIREQIAEELGIEDMAPYKQLVKDTIMGYLNEASGEDDQPQPPKRAKSSAGTSVSAGGSELSPELAAVLGYTHLKRTEVVKLLWEYIREHSLQNPSDKRNIMLDDKLGTLFEEPLTMFNMNKQLTKHIIVGNALYTGSGGGSSTPQSKPKKSSGGGSGGKKKSGFSKPIVLSDDLAAWYGKSQASRAAVVKHFHAYIKEHDLKDPTNKQFVLSDDVLVNLTGQKRFRAFGVTKYINKHFLVDLPAEEEEEEEEEEAEDEDDGE